MATCRLRRDDVHDDVPEGLQREDKRRDVVEREINHAGLHQGIYSVDTGWDLKR